MLSECTWFNCDLCCQLGYTKKQEERHFRGVISLEVWISCWFLEFMLECLWILMSIVFERIKNKGGPNIHSVISSKKSKWVLYCVVIWSFYGYCLIWDKVHLSCNYSFTRNKVHLCFKLRHGNPSVAFGCTDQECIIDEISDDDEAPAKSSKDKKSNGPDSGKSSNLVFKITSKVPYKTVMKGSHSCSNLRISSPTSAKSITRSELCLDCVNVETCTLQLKVQFC